MKIREVMEAYNYINTLKLNKFDKDIRIKLVKNYPLLSKVVKDYEEYRETLQKKMFEDKQEEIAKVQEIRSRISKNLSEEEIQQINSELQNYIEYFKLEAEFIQLINQKLEEDVEVSLTYIDKNGFIDNLAKSEVDFTFTDLLKINILFE